MKYYLQLLRWFQNIVAGKEIDRQWHKLNTSYNAMRRCERHQYERDLAKARKVADEISRRACLVIDRCHDIQFDRQHADQYVVQVAFDVRMLGGFRMHKDLDFIAEHIGHQVEAEIASSRFIQSARGLEQERLDHRQRCYSMYPRDLVKEKP